MKSQTQWKGERRLRPPLFCGLDQYLELMMFPETPISTRGYAKLWIGKIELYNLIDFVFAEYDRIFLNYFNGDENLGPILMMGVEGLGPRQI